VSIVLEYHVNLQMVAVLVILAVLIMRELATRHVCVKILPVVGSWDHFVNVSWRN
jgi:hypothetical protein